MRAPSENGQARGGGNLTPRCANQEAAERTRRAAARILVKSRGEIKTRSTITERFGL